MFGFPAAEVVGRDGSQLYTEEEYKLILMRVRSSAESERARTASNSCFPQKDGSRLPVIISSRNV